MWRVCLAFAAMAFGVRADDAEPMGTVIGIDLGTTYSCVGVFKGGRVEIIANDQGNRITPSYVAWDSNGERLIGDAAKNQATVNPETTVFDVKRLIGRQFNDKSVQADMKLFPFKIINKDNKPQVQVCGLFGPSLRLGFVVVGLCRDTVVLPCQCFGGCHALLPSAIEGPNDTSSSIVLTYPCYEGCGTWLLPARAVGSAPRGLVLL